MVPQAPALPVDEQDLYPLHEEDDVPEIPRHERQTRELRDAISVHRPDLYLTGNVCIYWERNNFQRYRAPDIMVTAAPLAHPEPRVCLIWRDPPILFVAEIGSRSTFREDEGPKQEIYGELIKAREYLYSDPPNGQIRLWRLGTESYEEVAPEANGRLQSVELGLEFAIDEDGDLRAYTLGGERLRTHEESEHDREKAEARAREEARQREEAERQRQDAERRREEAEIRAEAERARREEVERQLTALQEALRRRGTGAPTDQTSSGS
jgi:Uma2 family endonuclease